MNGIEVSRRYWESTVRPILRSRWGDVPVSAARLGQGSEVLGYDDDLSRDHDWGLRLTVVVPADLVKAVDDLLEAALPETVDGLPTRFAMSHDPRVRHRIVVTAIDDLARAVTGLSASGPRGTEEWLALSGQRVLEYRGGSVFEDANEVLATSRDRFAWYPDEVWRYRLAEEWWRIAEELPFVGRAGDRGDELGSRVIGARLVETAMRLGFLLDGSWAPYSKWLGTAFARLPRASAALRELVASLEAQNWQGRESHLCSALEMLGSLARLVGLPTPQNVVIPFFDRGFRTVEPIGVALRAGLADRALRDRSFVR